MILKMRRRFWYLLACLSQHRAERRIAKAEKFADDLIVWWDRQLAIDLRILPAPQPSVSVNNLLFMLGNAPPSQRVAEAQILGLLQQRRLGDLYGNERMDQMFAQQSPRYTNMLGALGSVAGPFGSLAGSALGAVLGDLVGTATKGRV